MAPTYAAADLAYRLAANNLSAVCTGLEYHLPPTDDLRANETLLIPSKRPRETVVDDSLVECQRCVAELADLEAGDRTGHECTHRGQADETATLTRPTDGVRKRQPNAGVIRQDLVDVKEKFEVFTKALTTLAAVCETQEEADSFERHLLVWAEYIADVRARAQDTLQLLEAPVRAEIVRQAPPPAQISRENSAGRVGADDTSDQANGRNANDHATDSTGTGAIRLENGLNPTNDNAEVTQNAREEDPGANLGNTGNGAVVTDGNAALDLAVRALLHIKKSIDADLHSLEREVAEIVNPSTELYLNELKEVCTDINTRINRDMIEAAEKVASIDPLRASRTGGVISDKLTEFSNRLRTVQASIRRARMTVVLGSQSGGSVSDHSSRETTPVADTSRSYKPYIEKLKPPVFSGKVEDWPEFRRVWADLFAELPESVQVQHIRTNVPAADAKRIAGVKTLKEVWERLERVYGDKELNIVTVKSCLEAFVPKAAQDHKKIQEVYEAVEKAVTQLENLDALQHLKDDFSLMNRLVLKLPLAEQRRYSDYVTAVSVELDTSSKWDKFWVWLKSRHKSAVQAGLMLMCDTNNQNKTSGTGNLRSGITCNTCGGLGHYARNCSSKPKSGSGPTVKVNVAVTKINTRNEYNQHLPDTKRQVGNCRACNQVAHNYSRQFPFGRADWPSTRLDTCTQFQAMTPRQRGELVERLKGCYRCTSWQHQGNECFRKNRSGCNVVTGGVACGGEHHKMLHGSGVAFCHKITVRVSSVNPIQPGSYSQTPDTSGPPDINQPVLLEVQNTQVHGQTAKTMFDNGSTAALITHTFAEKAGLQGEKIAYWLVVVGHDSVLRHTTLYSFTMVDNLGREHVIRAFGIDQITDDTRNVDLSGVMKVFPGAPREVFQRPQGPIDVLIGSMYRNIQPYGGEEGFTVGRLRLVRSFFGSGFILTGTHPSISVCENKVTTYAKTLVNCAMVERNVDVNDQLAPVVSCNRAVASLKIPEFFDAEDLGVAPARSCKRCRGCRDCSYRNAMVTRDKEMVVRRMEDEMQYDESERKVTVTYPWTEDVYKLTDNIQQAVRMQTSVEKRLLKDPALLQVYNDEFKKFVDRGVISRIPQEEIDLYEGPVSYVTHLPVFKPESTTTPLRLVTNTSFVNQNAKLSPNNCMSEGPNALSSLLEVVIGFRFYEVALVYDLTKAYQSIKTGKLERHVRRVVWRYGNTSEDWQIFGYDCVTFGDQAAGLALELVKALAADLGQEMDREASYQIRHRTYVDDGAGGGTRETVQRLRGNLVNGNYDGTLAQILGLVNLKPKVMIASGDDDQETLDILGDRILGHGWRPREDELVFKVAVNLTPARTKKRTQTQLCDMTEEDIPRLINISLTKRILLGLVNRQYDPMGLICPILIILKIHLRELFGPEVDLDWDDPIGSDMKEKWLTIISMLLRMGEIVIDRAVRPEGAVDPPELIGFSDGSLAAYACAVYVRWRRIKCDETDPDRYFVKLVCAKARVTSVRGTTAPRSEVSGYLILTRLLKVVLNAMDSKPSRVTIAMDSQCTISAAGKSGGLLAPYFSSRISESAANLYEISEETTVDPLQHVPGILNPADIPTRTLTTPEEVMEGSIWQCGPSYLTLPREQWPFTRDFIDSIPKEELRTPRAAFGLVASEVWSSPLGPKLTRIVLEIMERSNCLSKTVHVTARILKSLFDMSRDRMKEPLTLDDIELARRIQFIASMGPTFEALEKDALDMLRPITYKGIVYMRSRCGESLMDLFGVSRLPILARKSRLAYLIMMEAHCEDHRAGSTDVLARSRQRAWVIRGRYLAKEVCASCWLCKLNRRKLTEQLMADIPPHQLRPCPPFSYISLDFAGPYLVRAMGNSRAQLKVWGLVIVCQNTRAIKMYATAGYSTDDFLTAFTRFTANHGNPLVVVSDAGSQLVKAGKLVDQFDPSKLNWNKIIEGAAKNGTRWKNIQPGCQWRNGLAEAAVKLVKTTLGHTLANQRTLNYAELDTLFSSVANVVNQRPIAVQYYTEEDYHAITPNDLLLQRSKNTVPGVQYAEEESLTKRQQIMKEIEDTWWRQWFVQALPQLVPYKKWRVERRSLQVGDIVLVQYDKNVGKADYRLARVLKVHPDAHKVVRTVTVGFRKTNRNEATLPYVPKPLQEMELGVQRLVVICPKEEQTEETTGTHVGSDAVGEMDATVKTDADGNVDATVDTGTVGDENAAVGTDAVMGV